MNRCRESSRVQEWLDGDLAAPAASAFRAHLEGCRDCAAELRAYENLLSVLERDRAAFEDPGPALTERILDRVLPSRLRRRRVTVIGWVYGAASAVSTFAFVSWIAQPTTPLWLTSRFSEATLRVSQILLFSFQAFTRSMLEALDGWAFLGTLAARVAPIGRALARPLGEPVLTAVMLAAAFACAGVLWWMRPGRRSEEGMENVGLLGF